MKYRLVLTTAIIAVFALWFMYPTLITSEYAKVIVPKGDWGARGVVGDSFGALNALFGGLALAGLAINIYMQSAQLEKLELREAENEKQIKNQANYLRLTALLNYHNSEIDRLDRLAESYGDSINGKIEQQLWDRHKTLRAKRDEIVKDLSVEII